MENSLKLQMDVKNNAEDLRRYMLDLQSWEEEMKPKDIGLKNRENKIVNIPPPRNKIKRNIKDGRGDEKILPDNDKKPKKIHAYDYSAWDKYDVEKACAEIDEEPEQKTQASQPSNQGDENREEKEDEKENEIAEVDSSNLKKLDEAFYEKELGNLFVRKEKWEDAIKCYTRAIELDSRNAIYYANRALCFIKLKKSAEVDATVAIQLDNTYVKAYQRRAFVRLALGQIEEALSDYREVVKLEPNNAYANSEIIKIEKKLKSGESNVKEAKTEKKIFDPKTIFKSTTKKKVPVKSNQSETKEEVKKEEENKKVEMEKYTRIPKENSVSDADEWKKKVEEVKIETSSERKKKVEEVKMETSSEVKKNDDIFGEIPDGFSIVKPVQVPPHLRSKKPFRRVPVKDIISESETFNEFVNMSNSMISQNEATENKPENQALILTREEVPESNEIENFPKPNSFLQFQQVWKVVKKNPEHAITYLQKTTSANLFRLLRHNLESDLFSELISVLSTGAEANSELVYSILLELIGIDRFGSLVLFLSTSDKKNLNDCVNNLKSTRTDIEIEYLRETYQLYGFA